MKSPDETLNDLAAMAELIQLGFGTGTARFDSTLEPRHHLAGDRCGSVRDVHADFDTVALPARSHPGCRRSTTRIAFGGLCPSCRADADDRLVPTSSSTAGVDHPVHVSPHKERAHG